MYNGLSAHKTGLLFLLAIIVAFTQGGIWAGRRRRNSNFPDNSLLPSASSIIPFGLGDGKPVIKEHPIPKLMSDAEESFRQLLSKQSKTLEAAVAEYERRYGRKPPRGFDDWWRFAKDNDVLMIDEYDGVNEDLAPFWALSGEDVRQRATLAGHLPSIDLVRVRDGKATAVNVKDGPESGDVSARARGFALMLDKFQHQLPDLDFPINAMAEGRILVPWEQRVYPNLTTQSGPGSIEAELSGVYAADWRGEGNVWEAYRRTCEPGTPARRLFSSLRAPSSSNRTSQLAAQTEEFMFMRSVSGNYSFCHNPWAHYDQGHFFSDWRTIPVLFPVFSPARAPGYSDIRIPSHYYYGQTRRYTYGYDPVNLQLKQVDHMEAPWEQKSDKIFWRGASTGGGSSPPGFAAQYQRHRLVRMASDSSDTNRTVVFADPPGSAHYVAAEVPVGRLNEEVMDVAFVKVVDWYNYPGGLDALVSKHRFDDGGVNLGDHWKHKYLIDVDGMGYSGRFFSFIESDSAVIKSTVYREFFSDWIQPWLHYIPLSQSYQEIYNIHAFFSGGTASALEAVNSTALEASPAARRTIDGDRRLRRIARAGKQWKRTIGRRVDMEAYVYRLCLEYARLLSDDRDSMSFML